MKGVKSLPIYFSNRGKSSSPSITPMLIISLITEVDAVALESTIELLRSAVTSTKRI